MKISVLQWNVWYKEKADNIISFLKSQDADILCLQELTTGSHINPLRNLPEEIAALGYNPLFQQTLEKQKGTEYYHMGNGIFSKFPITGNRHVYIQHEVPGGGYELENRVYVEARLDINGKPFTIGTVHMSYIEEFKTTEGKKAETERLIGAIKQNTEHFLLTGDLNATPGTETIRMLDEVLSSAGPTYDQPTWTTKPFEHLDFKANTLDWRLDYAYATKDVKIVSGKILQTDASDHLPILIEIDA